MVVQPWQRSSGGCWLREGDRQMELWELSARECIRDIANRYACSVDSGRFTETVSLFTAEAVFELGGERYVGHEQILGIFTAAGRSLGSHQAGARLVRHHLTTQQIDVDSAGTARSRLYFMGLPV